jgi:hypothetical protein
VNDGAPEYDLIMAVHLLGARRLLASATILHDALMSQSPLDALLACTDVMLLTPAIEATGMYLAEKPGIEEEASSLPDPDLVAHYNALLLKAAGGDELVLMEEAFDIHLDLLTRLASDD